MHAGRLLRVCPHTCILMCSTLTSMHLDVRTCATACEPHARTCLYTCRQFKTKRRCERLSPGAPVTGRGGHNHAYRCKRRSVATELLQVALRVYPCVPRCCYNDCRGAHSEGRADCIGDLVPILSVPLPTIVRSRRLVAILMGTIELKTHFNQKPIVKN